MDHPQGPAAAATPASRRPWLLVAALAGVPAAAAALLAAQAWYAGATVPMPDLDPGYDVKATVGPEASGLAPLRLVALGDSTTAGVGAPSMDAALPVQVAERVAATLQRPVTVTGVGVSGAKTAEITATQAAVLTGAAPDAVLVVTGANDVTGLTPPWTLRRDTQRLLDRVRASTDGAPVVLGSIPRFGPGMALPEPLRWTASTYASVLRRVQRDVVDDRAGVRFVDLAREADPRFEGRPDAFSADGYHPSPVGYGFWADALAPAVVAALRGDGDALAPPSEAGVASAR